MTRIVEWTKEHPKLAAALVIGLVVLIYLYRRGQSSASQSSAATVGSTGLSEQGYLSQQSQELSAATQLQGQTIGANVAMAQLTDQLQAQQSHDANLLAIAKLQSDTQVQTLYDQTQLGEIQISAQKEVALATIDANSKTSADQLALELALVNVLAGRNNVLNPSPSQPLIPVVTSSAPNQPGYPAAAPNTGADQGQVSNPNPIGFGVPRQTPTSIPGLNVVTLPGSAPSGYSEIPGVTYTMQGQPFQPDYSFPNEQAAVAAGAGHIDSTTGRFVAAQGLQVTY